ncbi:MAG: hypothetical protein QM296_13790 [Bacillota bacterium]|nr:hypothetical protein [Bacillota bacterium]
MINSEEIPFAPPLSQSPCAPYSGARARPPARQLIDPAAAVGLDDGDDAFEQLIAFQKKEHQRRRGIEDKGRKRRRRQHPDPDQVVERANPIAISAYLATEGRVEFGIGVNGSAKHTCSRQQRQDYSHKLFERCQFGSSTLPIAAALHSFLS